METQIIKGESARDRLFSEIKNEINVLREQRNKVPGVVFIGFEGVPLGKYNMPLHVGTAQQLGFNVFHHILPENVSEDMLEKIIDDYNKNDDVNAIVLLQPLPAHLNPLLMAEKIDPGKEVEGFHPVNLAGTLMPDTGLNKYQMCLPAALRLIFEDEKIVSRSGSEWLFVLDEEFFRNPLTYMIVRAAASKVVPNDCPVAFISKGSEKLEQYCKRADFLVIVSKVPEYLDPQWLKPGVCIIDIYSNLVREVQSKADPSRLVPVIRGGVNVESVKGIAGAILPVPGGLMTVVLGILFKNILISFKSMINNN